MVTYTTISTDNENYQLSALLVEGKYVYPSLKISFIDDDGLCLWDNEEFLIEELYPFLKNEKIDLELAKQIPKEDIPEILELFKEAMELGFFDIA